MADDKLDGLKKACIAALKTYFGVDAPDTSELHKNTKRENVHYTLTLPDGSIYGFKNWSTAGKNEDVPSECSERDRLFNKIAHVVRAPHVCETRYCSDITVEPFNDEPVVISRWILDAKSVEEFEEEDKEKLRTNGRAFFRKYGEWIALGEALGFRDWTPNNLVWADKTQALALIDLDWCFNCGKDGVSNFAELIQCLRPIAPADIDAYINELKSGVAEMQEKLEKEREAIEEVLKVADSEKVRKFTLTDISTLAERAEKLLREKLKSPDS